MFSLEVEKGLKLVLVQPSFAQLYFEIVKRERAYLGEWLAWPAHADSRNFFLDFIKRSLHDYAEGKSLVCAIFYDDSLVGTTGFNSINHELKKVEIGYWLSSKYSGKGIVSKSVSKLIDMAFTDLDMEKVQISVAVENQPSRRVCERLDMNEEGVITNEEKIGDRILDHVIYGLHKNNYNKRH